jgi:hypothetical protein
MKKYVLFVLGLGLLSVLAFGMTGSGAWFTSTLQMPNNVITSGTLKLGVEGGPFVAASMEPGAGWKDMGWFCVTNRGDYNAKWRAWIEDVKDRKGLSNYLRLRVTLNPHLDPPLQTGNYGPQDTVLFEDVPFTDLLSAKNTNLLLDDTTIAPGDALFSPTSRVCYRVEAKLSADAGDEQQNGTLTARLHVLGTQWIAPW